MRHRFWQYPCGVEIDLHKIICQTRACAHILTYKNPLFLCDIQFNKNILSRTVFHSWLERFFIFTICYLLAGVSPTYLTFFPSISQTDIPFLWHISSPGGVSSTFPLPSTPQIDIPFLIYSLSLGGCLIRLPCFSSHPLPKQIFHSYDISHLLADVSNYISP